MLFYLAAFAVAAATAWFSAPALAARLLMGELPFCSDSQQIVASATRRVETEGGGFVVRVFYATKGSTKAQRGRWLPRPAPVYLHGLAHFLRLPPMANVLLQALLSVKGGWVEDHEQCLPLLAGARMTPLPVVVFSHGLGGTSTMYSILCAGLASRGYFVLAIEHSDGSAAATVDSAGSEILYQRASPILLGADEGHAWRHGQQERRVEQVFEALRWALRGGEPGSPEQWRGCLDPERVAIMGHSFGGSTAVAAAARGGFCCSIVLDGWLWPLSKGGPIAKPLRSFGASSACTPMLFIDAESYVSDERWWRSKVELVGRAERSSALVSLVGSVHYTFSDVLVLGGGGIAMLQAMRRKSSRPVASAEEQDGGRKARDSHPAGLLDEVTRLCAAFLNTHVDRHSTSGNGWVSGILRNDRFRVLAMSEDLVAFPLVSSRL